MKPSCGAVLRIPGPKSHLQQSRAQTRCLTIMATLSKWLPPKPGDKLAAVTWARVTGQQGCLYSHVWTAHLTAHASSEGR